MSHGYSPVTHVTHTDLLTHVTHDPLTHCQLWSECQITFLLQQHITEVAVVIPLELWNLWKVTIISKPTSSFYRPDAHSVAQPTVCKLPVLNLLTGQKSSFSPRRGDSLHQFRSNLAETTGTRVRLAQRNFTSIGAGWWECGPKISKISTFW